MNALHRFLTVVLLTVAGSLYTCESWANMTNARIAAHYKPKFVASKTIPYLCDNPATQTVEPNYSPNYENLPCYNYNSNGLLGPGQVYAVVGRAGTEGVMAASFGVAYAGSDGAGIDPRFVTWTSCTDGLQFPNSGANGEFPAPGGGLRITWSTCQTQVIGVGGVHAVIGVFYVYAYSDAVLDLTSNYNLQTGPELSVADCAGAETNLLEFWPSVSELISGSVGFGSRFGWNACYCCDASQSTTWGKMKSMYGSSITSMKRGR